MQETIKIGRVTTRSVKPSVLQSGWAFLLRIPRLSPFSSSGFMQRRADWHVVSLAGAGPGRQAV